MKIRCIINKLNQISDEKLKSELETHIQKHYPNEPIYGLEIGEEFTVYAIIILQNGWPKYGVVPSGDALNGFYYYSSILFEVIDPRPSKYWIFQHEAYNYRKELDSCTTLAFKEWIEENYFYSNLIDGDDKDRRELKVFIEYKKLMDEEFKEVNEFEGL